MKHDIPEWYIPDEKQVLANDHEKEEIEETGELEEPLCPYCGESYQKEKNGRYGHGPMIQFGGGAKSPGVWCSEDNTRERTRQYRFILRNGETEAVQYEY